MSPQTITFPVSGMSCANCAMNIERSVKKLPGIFEANVNLATEQATLSYDPKEVTLSEIVEKIRKAGFAVDTVKAEFPVRGMTCANCAMNIERTLNKKVSGVVGASVNFASERAMVEYLPTVTSLDEMASAIKKAGYEAILSEKISEIEDSEQKIRLREIKDQTRKFAICIALKDYLPENYCSGTYRIQFFYPSTREW